MRAGFRITLREVSSDGDTSVDFKAVVAYARLRATEEK